MVENKSEPSKKLSKQEFNNFIIQSRKLVHYAVQNTIQILTRKAANFRNKNTKRDEEKEKNHRKADNCYKQVKALKLFHEYDVLKFSILCKKSHNEVFKDLSSTDEERALVRVANHPHMKKIVNTFKETYPSWSEEVPTFIKTLGAQYRRRRLARLEQKGKTRKEFFERERKFLLLLHKLTGLDLDPRMFRTLSLQDPKTKRKLGAAQSREEEEEGGRWSSLGEEEEGDEENSSDGDDDDDLLGSESEREPGATDEGSPSGASGEESGAGNRKNKKKASSVTRITSIFESIDKEEEEEVNHESEEKVCNADANETESTTRVGSNQSPVSGSKPTTSPPLLSPKDKRVRKKTRVKATIKEDSEAEPKEDEETDVSGGSPVNRDKPRTVFEVKRINLNETDEIVFAPNDDTDSERHKDKTQNPNRMRPFSAGFSRPLRSGGEETLGAHGSPQVDLKRKYGDQDGDQSDVTSKYFKRKTFRGEDNARHEGRRGSFKNSGKGRKEEKILGKERWEENNSKGIDAREDRWHFEPADDRELGKGRKKTESRSFNSKNSKVCTNLEKDGHNFRNENDYRKNNWKRGRGGGDPGDGRSGTRKPLEETEEESSGVRRGGFGRTFKGRSGSKAERGRRGRTRGFDETTANIIPLGEKKPGPSQSELNLLHPSWLAKRKQSQEASKLRFEGKRTTFD